MNIRTCAILLATSLIMLGAGSKIEILPSKEFLYKHGYEFVGKPVKDDKRIIMYKMESTDKIYYGTTFYIKNYLITAHHVSINGGGFTKISAYDASYKTEYSKDYFEINDNGSNYRGPCVIYGYIDGVLRRFDGEVIRTEKSGDTMDTRLNLIAKMRIRSGASGGPVVDKDGKIIGVAHSTNNNNGAYETTIAPIDKLIKNM